MQTGVFDSQDNLKHTYLTDSSESLPGSVDLRGGDLHQYLERLSLQRLKQATLFPPVSEQRPVSINFLPVRGSCACRAAGAPDHVSAAACRHCCVHTHALPRSQAERPGAGQSRKWS